VKTWGIAALHRAIQGLKCTTCVHLHTATASSEPRLEETLGGEWRQYGGRSSRAGEEPDRQVSLECIIQGPSKLLALLKARTCCSA